MSLETTLKGLQDNALALARFYSKDFGAHLTGIQASAEVYLHKPNQERRQSIEHGLEIIDELYKTISVDELLGDQRYAPLLVVHQLLPKVREKMGAFFENPVKATYEEFFLICNVIHEVGNVYRRYFERSLEKVRAHPEGNNFRVKLVGITGKEWNY